MTSVAYVIAAMLLRVGNAGAAVALPLLSVERLHDLRLGGVLVALALAPSVIAAPFAGVALDRVRSPRALVAVSGVICGGALGMASLLGDVPLPLIAAGLVVSGVASPFFLGGLSSFAPDAFPGERTAYAADALTYNLGAVAGPGLAAVLVGLGSARLALLVLAIGSVVGAAALAGVRFRPRDGGGVPVGRALIGGLRHLATHRPLAVSTASGTLTQLAAGALPVLAVPIALDRTGSAAPAGWIVTAFAVGALAGVALTALPTIRRTRAVTVMAAGFAATGVLTLLGVPDLGLPTLLVAIGLAGAATAPAVASMLYLRERLSPPAVRGQVFTVAAGLRTTVAALGAAAAALLAGAHSGVLVAALGGVWLASAALMLAYPWRVQGSGTAVGESA